MSRFIIKDAGILSSVQDAGRYGFQRYGVGTTGVMDEFSYQVANKLVGNDIDEAVIETTMKGITFEALDELVFAVTGANTPVFINDEPISLWESYKIKSGDIVKMGVCKDGLRNYIAFGGGIDIKPIMGSRTTNMKAGIGGVDGRKLHSNDELRLIKRAGFRPLLQRFRDKESIKFSQEPKIRVILGQQVDEFTDEGIDTFLSATYQVTDKIDRMGMRLEGEAIAHKNGADIISDGMTTGAIQVPGNGQPIIMMVDHQTTGGYTKIANVIAYDLPLLAQTKAGAKIKFVSVDVDEAVELLRKMQEHINAPKNYISKAKGGFMANLCSFFK